MNQKVVTLCINGGKISARILKDALAKLLKKMEQMERQKLQELKINRKEKGAVSYHGKQSMEKLMKQNCQLTNIEVTDGNIKSPSFPFTALPSPHLQQNLLQTITDTW